MSERFEKVIECVETVQWRVKTPPAGIPAADLTAIINAAVIERQGDVHRGRNPGELTVRSTDEHTVTRSTSTIIVSYRRTTYGHDLDDFQEPDRDDEPES